MGEGQSPAAERALTIAMSTGSWVLLQNCHLALDFMEHVDTLLRSQSTEISESFRLFLTVEPHPDFPVSLLQISTKVRSMQLLAFS